ncbi:MAG: sensor histidine kinase [Pseudanabaenaceae cyanobacterium]
MTSVAVPCREHHARAFQSSPSAIVITTLATGRILEANASFSRLTGYPHRELLGRTTTELGLWYQPGDRRAIVAQLEAEGCLRNAEFRFRTKDGRIGIGLFSAEVLPWDGEPALIATVHDITEYKRMQNQLKAALERDRLLGEVALRIRRSLELSEILATTTAEVRQVLAVDRVFVGWRDAQTGEGRIAAESCDPQFPSMRHWVLPPDKVCAATAMFPTDRATAIDDAEHSDFFRNDADFREAFCVRAVLIAPIWQGGRFLGVLGVHQCSGPRLWQPYEVELLEKLATHVAIAMHQAQLYQQVCGLNGTLEQQVRERTEQLQQRLVELQELSELKDFFLQAVTHDLRTPLVGMQLLLDNLLTKYPTEETIALPRAVVERLQRSSGQQLAMLDRLLDSHALEVGTAALHCEAVGLSELVAAVVHDFQPTLTQNEATVHLHLAADLPMVRADPLQLRRVLENLVTNALKHNPPGLTLTLTTRRDGSHLRCEVIDDGVGLENVETLFERYVRGKGSRYQAGLGLGLYLCRQIVEAHGGQIGACSTPGAGAQFWFRLPIAHG